MTERYPHLPPSKRRRLVAARVARALVEPPALYRAKTLGRLLGDSWVAMGKGFIAVGQGLQKVKGVLEGTTFTILDDLYREPWFPPRARTPEARARMRALISPRKY